MEGESLRKRDVLCVTDVQKGGGGGGGVWVKKVFLGFVVNF
jgi:hypothetical protein